MNTGAISPQRREWALMTAVWAVCSTALMVARPSYPFPPFELLDSWIYTAYQWDLSNQIADFGPTYYGSRLPWILPGALLHSCLPPVVAAILFKLLFSALLTAACASVVRTVAGLHWALIATALATLTPQIVIALQTDYVDGPVIVFAAVTLLGITRARESTRWPLWIGLAGAGLAAMLTTNLGAASTIGFGLAVVHLLWLRWGVKRTLGAAGAYALGATLVLLLLAWGSRGFGGDFNFLKPQLDMLRYFKEVERNPWVPTDFEWLTRAHWLILPLGAVLWAATRLAATRGADSPRRRLILALACGLAASLLASAVMEFRATGAVLSLSYYVSFNLALAIPLLALMAADYFDDTPPAWRWIIALLGAILAIVTIATPVAGWRLFAPIASLLGGADRVPMAAAGVLILAGIATARLHHRLISAPLGVAFFIVWLFLSLPTGFHGPEVSDRLRERYLAVHDAYFTLKRELPNRSFRFWVDDRHRDGVSLASTKLWGYRLLTLSPFPKLEYVKFRDITIVVPLAPGEGARAIDQLHDALKPRHLEAENPRIRAVPGSAGTGFDLLLFELRGAIIDPERVADGGPRAQMIAGYEYHGAPPYTTRLGIARADGRHADALSHEAGRAVFHRVEENDHLATGFQPLPSKPVNDPRILAIVTVMPVDGDCTVEIQDGEFRQLGSISLQAAGRVVHNFELPPEATEYRLCFFSRRNASTALPININVYLVEPGVLQH